MPLATNLVAVCTAEATDAIAIRRALEADVDLTWVEVCGTLSQFLELTTTSLPQVALVAARLPDGSVLDLLRAAAVAERFPVVVLVDRGDEAGAAMAEDAGAVDRVICSAEAWADLPHTIARARRAWGWQQRCRQANERSILQSRLLDALDHSAIATDRNGVVTYWNRSSQDLYGWSAGEAIGHPLVGLIAPQVAGGGPDGIAQALSGGRAWAGRCDVTGKRGVVTPVQMTVSPIANGNNGPLGAICFSHEPRETAPAALAPGDAEAPLHAMLARMPAILFAVDTNGVITLAEGGNLDELGLGGDQLVGRSAYDFYLDNPPARQAIGRVLAGEEGRATYRFRDQWLDARVAPLRDASGRVSGAVGCAIDITESKMALEAAKQSEERYRALVEAIPDAVVVLDHEWRVRLVNLAGEHFFGMPRAQLLGSQVLRLFPEIGSTPFFQAFEQVMLTRQQQTVTGEYAPAGGRRRWYEAMVSPVPQGVLCICRDITERRRVEQALSQAEVKYRAVVERVPAVIYSVARRPGGREGFISPRVQHMLGFTPEEWFDGAEFWATRLYPDDRDRVVAAADRLYTDGEPFNEDYRYMAKNGRTVWVHEETAAVPGADDEALFFHGVLTDITELKLAQEALQQSQAAYELVVGTMEESLSVFDGEGTCLFANRTLARLIADGDPSQLVGRNVAELLPPDQAQRLIAGYRDTIASARSSEKDILITTKLGDRWFHNTLQPINYVAGAGMAVLSICHDITEQVQAEQAMREAEARWQFALEGAGDGVWDWDLRSGKAYFSPQWKRILGYSESEIGDRISEWRDRVVPEDLALCDEALERHLRGETPLYSKEHRVRVKDGSCRWMLGRGKVILQDDDGRPLRIIGTQTDITDGKRAEQERLEMERRLLHGQKLESLGVLAGGIAHDFNNLLAAIVGNLDLSLQELSPLSAARPGIESAAAAAQRAADLTRQMLAYSGRGRFVTQRMNLSELVEENAHMLRAAISRNVTLRTDLDRRLPPIMADPGQVQQVVMNLITNASEAIGEGSGVVAISTGARYCDEAYLRQSRLEEKPVPGRFVVLKVSDTGCGMTEDTQSRLFDPFFSTKFVGRGLGMSAVQGILRSHGGAVLVRSEVGRGSTITVLFPAPEGEPQPETVAAGDASAATPAELSGTVLVVDDEEAVRSLCARMVARSGLRGLTAAGGEEAVRLFRQHADEIVCVILDLTMPELDGAMTFEALKRIRPDVKVVLCSGYGEHEATRRFAGRGLAGFVQKPYRTAVLQAELERVLAGGG
ncbi:MAG: PAS domain S-box protein [Anaerolineae bacterium]